MNFFRNIVEKFRGGKPVDWDDLEEALLRADLGLPLTLRILDRVREHPGGCTADTVYAVARAEIAAILAESGKLESGKLENRAEGAEDNFQLSTFNSQLPYTILMVGVNGTGKTTSTAKLAAWLRRKNHSVLLAAADTFRAAAIEQLQTWGSRLDVPVVAGAYNADPASLCHDAWRKASKDGTQFLICDTAGRLHTKGNLMKELEKISRTLAKLDPQAPQEKLLVVDATTGSNAIVQAREFHNAIGLTGLVVTKLDGSGKGGIVAAIATELSLPTRFVGTGETLEDFEPFDPEKFTAEMI